jgi:actin, other eukaryote
MAEESQILVIDNGSGVLKAGISGEDAPRCIIHTLVGRFREKDYISLSGTN